MSKPSIKIHNVENDEIIEREMTQQEYAQFLTDKKSADEKNAAIVEKEAKKLALLERLGISQEEAKILLS